MRSAHEAGEEEVQRELVKRLAQESTSPSTSSITSPSTLLACSHDEQAECIGYSPESYDSAEKGELVERPTITPTNNNHLDYAGRAWEALNP